MSIEAAAAAAWGLSPPTGWKGRAFNKNATFQFCFFHTIQGNNHVIRYVLSRRNGIILYIGSTILTYIVVALMPFHLSWCCYDYDTLLDFWCLAWDPLGLPNCAKRKQVKGREWAFTAASTSKETLNIFSKLLDTSFGGVPNMSALYLIIWSCATSTAFEGWGWW